METTKRVKSPSEQVAEIFLDNHQAFGPVSLGELATGLGTTKSAARAGLRIAEPTLNSRGESLTAAKRAAGWKVEVTSELSKFQGSTVDRLSAVAVEFSRYAAHELAVAKPGETMVFKDIVTALQTALATV